MMESRWLITPDSTQCEFESRARPLTRAPGILGLMFGGFIGSWPVLIAAFFYWALQEAPDFDKESLNLIRLAFLIFALVCTAPSAYVIHRSLLLLFGTKQICIDEQRLRFITRLGPLRQTRTIRLGQLTGFQLEEPKGVGPLMVQGYSSLFAVTTSGKRRILLRAYPVNELRKLAEQLEQHILRITQRDVFHSRLGTGPPSLRTEKTSLNPYSIEPRNSPPLGSQLACYRQPDSLTIDLPRLGLKKTTEGGGGLFLATFVIGELFILFGLIPALLMGKVEGQPLAGWIIATVFTLLTTGLIILVMNAATRRGQIRGGSEGVTFTEWDMWGKHENHWTASELKAIEVGVTEQTSDGDTTWTYFLDVTPASGKKRQWYSNRSKEELEWVATTLQSAVSILVPPPDSPQI